VRRVRLLLESRDDYLPSPPHVQLKAPSGPAASKFVPCEPCAQKGRVVYKGKERLCFTCDGTGSRRKRASDPEWCAYLGMPLLDARLLADATPYARRTVALTDEERERAFAWERKQAVYRQHGSYDELERALERLRVESPSAWHAVTRHYTWGVVVDEEAERRGLVWLAANMRSVRVPRWVKDTRPPDLRRLVLELAAQGKGAGTIGKLLKVPKVTVKRYLKTR
jgi:hypothetical protein